MHYHKVNTRELGKPKCLNEQGQVSYISYMHACVYTSFYSSMFLLLKIYGWWKKVNISKAYNFSVVCLPEGQTVGGNLFEQSWKKEKNPNVISSQNLPSFTLAVATNTAFVAQSSVLRLVLLRASVDSGHGPLICPSLLLCLVSVRFSILCVGVILGIKQITVFWRVWGYLTSSSWGSPRGLDRVLEVRSTSCPLNF